MRPIPVTPSTATGSARAAITTTPARQPVFRTDWLHPGLHLTAMGSDADYKQELEATAPAAADLFVADRVSQCETLGELRAARAAGLWPGDPPPELGQVLTGAHPGRTSDDQVTICDLTGTGAQDTAIAVHARARVAAAGGGQAIRV